MAELRTLMLLLEQAERERDAALAQCTEAQTRLGRAQAQIDDLRRFDGQYHQRWHNEGQSGLGIETLRCYQSYGQRLLEAIGQQGQLIQHLDQRLQTCRAELQARELRLASLRKLIERRQQELLQKQERQDQKITDEWAARSALGARGPHSAGHP
ncbi:flagellar FliJ protein [Inhella inkyongensis]|uniref:Flagellar FliJ protein n=1 Tax=Inhella inkyongensis TaxID=392593 RepID=A0A840SC37_9BURK|nr:flagellar export protein FliJ [Inhella inkyongensis]MBB5205899.1 flagellar FliJ protein [Inhella inkyongensis]